MERLIFPKWINLLRPTIAVLAIVAPVYGVVLVGFGASPRTTDVGYQPVQPVEYSHAMHVGQLGMDCRYCHNTVETSAVAAIPPTQTCMNCHVAIKPDSAKLINVREAYATGMPIEWLRVHDLPDYAYFDHSAHVTRGVGCVSCHGRIDTMDVVSQDQPLSMGWCLDCHRDPAPNLRPVEAVTVMDWVPPDGDQLAAGKRVMEELQINPPTDCTACHR